MVNWLSPAEIQKDAAVFTKFIHVLLGLYIWEWFISLPFDWQYISGKRKFRWPLIFYFFGRYTLLFALIGIAIAQNVTSEINCQALYTFNQLFGNAAIGFASVNLSLRTMAVWGQRPVIVIPLVLISLGQWSLLLHGVLLKADWDPVAGCVITNTSNKLLAATFIYTMAFDLTVLILTAWKLAFPGGGAFSTAGRSRLVNLIFQDGLIYFVIAFVSNLLATTFMLLNLNPVMSIIANVPAAIGSTIVACRAVRRLTSFTSQGAEVFATTTQGSTLNFRSGAQSISRPKVNTKLPSDSVHVQVLSPPDDITYARAELTPKMDTFQSPSDKSFVEYDASGKILKGDDFDPEAQVIREEFKRPPY